MNRYSLGEIAINSKEKRFPTLDDQPTYIGLEHLDSGRIDITRYGSKVPLKGTKLVARKGDVLFGRRNAYLKRCAVAPFDCLFSAHGLVLRPNENVIDKAFFPYFMSSEPVLNEAIRISVGSLSPTVNWSTFSASEFCLPNLKKQRGLAFLLENASKLVTHYNNLLILCDDLVKSQFIEMFGDPELGTCQWPIRQLSDVLMIERGGSPRPISDYITEDKSGVNWIKIGDTSEDSIYIDSVAEKIKVEGAPKSRHVLPGDFLLSNSMSFGQPYILKIDGYIHDGWLVLRDNDKVFNTLYLYAALSSSYAQSFFDRSANGSTVKNLNKDIVGKLPIAIPSMSTQKSFSDFLLRVDKSKFELQKALDDLNAMTKKIVNQELGLGNV